MHNLDATCRDLWNEWRSSSPNDPLVKQSAERIAQYSKEDWVLMSSEAEALMEELANLSKNNIDIEDAMAKQAFCNLVEHLERWFFMPNIEFFNRLPHAISIDRNFKGFYNKYDINLAKYMIKLITRYKNEV